MNTKLFINGEFIATKEKQRIINTSTGKVIAEADMASEKEVELALSSARAAFDSVSAAEARDAQSPSRNTKPKVNP